MNPLFNDSVSPAAVAAVVAIESVRETSPSGLERRGKIRLPDGRVVFSDCFTGEAKSAGEAVAAAGLPVTVIVPEDRYELTGGDRRSAVTPPDVRLTHGPSGLARKHQVRLPDGRIVWSDCLVGDPISPAAAVAISGRSATLFVEEERFSFPVWRKPSEGQRRSMNRRVRIKQAIAAEPHCPRCHCVLVPSVPGRRSCSGRTACISPAGQVICAACRNAEVNRPCGDRQRFNGAGVQTGQSRIRGKAVRS